MDVRTSNHSCRKWRWWWFRPVSPNATHFLVVRYNCVEDHRVLSIWLLMSNESRLYWFGLLRWIDSGRRRGKLLYLYYFNNFLRTVWALWNQRPWPISALKEILPRREDGISRPLIGEVVNSDGVNSLGNKVATRLFWFLRYGLYSKGAHNSHTKL